MAAIGRGGGPGTSGGTGRRAEDRACALLTGQGLRLLHRNYRVAGGPGRPAGEIDLVLEDADGTLVLVEVRARAGRSAGGAAASVGRAKRARLLHAAACLLAAQPVPRPCRFDVVAIDGGRLQWLRAAFDAQEAADDAGSRSS